ncbi:HNH endonuclease [Priestia endophytica]|uniref:HNH endonuclease n=1 Tax=Priestia endophytica TaxID=135735 RepID=UPI002E1BF222
MIIKKVGFIWRRTYKIDLYLVVLEIRYLLAQINRGKAKTQDFTWYHYQVHGKTQLVVTNIHQANHLGGNKLWEKV